MISKGQFVDIWMKLEASHNRTLSNQIREEWFNELEGCEFSLFRSTIQRLKNGEHWKDGTAYFPKFQDYWRIYRRLESAAGSTREKTDPGCEKCRHGFIWHIQKIIPKGRREEIEHEVVSFCRDCFPDHPRAVNPDQAFAYVAGMEPWRLHNCGQVIPGPVACEMAKDLVKKIGRRGVDWDALEIEAWAQHKISCDLMRAAGGGR